MLRHDCGATLPPVQRYTDMRWRRVSRNNITRYDFDHVELCAFLHLVRPVEARWIFRWFSSAAWTASWQVLEHPGLVQAAQPLIRENLEGYSVDDCRVLIEAMRTGGWSGMGFPVFAHMPIRELRSRGLKKREIADELGLGFWTVDSGFRNRGKTAMPGWTTSLAGGDAGLVL